MNIENSKITPFCKCELKPSCVHCLHFAVIPSLVFKESEGHVGEPIFLQLCLNSNAQSNSSPTEVSQVIVNFDGPLNSVILKHKNKADESSAKVASRVTPISLQKLRVNEESWEGQADLTISSGETRIYEIEVICREAGFLIASDAKVTINGSQFTFAFRTSFSTKEVSANVWLHSSGNLKRSSTLGFLTIKILPKPPKAEVKFPGLNRAYYIDENTTLDLAICNNEDEEAYTSVEVRLLGHGDDPIDFSWAESSEVDRASENNDSVNLPGKQIALLKPSTTLTRSINFTAPSFPSLIVLEAKILYYLKSDLQTVISKSSSTQLEVFDPFKLDFQFHPRVHPAPWPNYFVYNGYNSKKEDEGKTDTNIDQEPTGLKQRWQLQATVTSLVHEPIIINEVTAILFDVSGGISCQIQETPLSTRKALENNGIQEWSFTLDTQKLSIEDRGSSSVDLNVVIRWKRSLDKPTEVTIEVPRLPIPSSEPRVLAAAQPLAFMPDAYLLEYTLENPTMHFLTFDLAMEASEDFAFSGCKYGSVNLLPISRQTMRVNIMPLTGNMWIRPQLRVADRYFNKTLKVLPTEGLAADKDGLKLYAGDIPS